jgi:membrane-bound ClpP family serine protease
MFRVFRFTKLLRKKLHPSWSRKTIVRYALLQLPVLSLVILILFILRGPLNLALWAVLLIVAAWIAKDFLMFFFVWRAYVPSGAAEPTKMIGKEGITTQDINPSGYVEINGELWYAESFTKSGKIQIGSEIIVREVHGLTLFVEEKGTKAQRNKVRIKEYRASGKRRKKE